MVGINLKVIFFFVSKLGGVCIKKSHVGVRGS